MFHIECKEKIKKFSFGFQIWFLIIDTILQDGEELGITDWIMSGLVHVCCSFSSALEPPQSSSPPSHKNIQISFYVQNVWKISNFENHQINHKYGYIGNFGLFLGPLRQEFVNIRISRLFFFKLHKVGLMTKYIYGEILKPI